MDSNFWMIVLVGLLVYWWIKKPLNQAIAFREQNPHIQLPFWVIFLRFWRLR